MIPGMYYKLDMMWDKWYVERYYILPFIFPYEYGIMPENLRV